MGDDFDRRQHVRREMPRQYERGAGNRYHFGKKLARMLADDADEIDALVSDLANIRAEALEMARSVVAMAKAARSSAQEISDMYRRFGDIGEADRFERQAEATQRKDAFAIARAFIDKHGERS